MEKPENPESPARTDLESAEAAYNRLAGYGFARRYIEGKTVADLDPRGTGTGARILAATARSVISLVSSPGALERIRETRAPNVNSELATLPELPFPEASLDVVIALEVIEDLQDFDALVAEARRVLKEDGFLIVSVPDRQIFSNRSKQGLYAAEFRELLGRHFDHVEFYRQGAVSGAAVFKDSGGLTGHLLESAGFAAAKPEFGDGVPDTDLILAVCGGVGLSMDERPYLLLDRDRRLLDEREDAREDVELLKAEIQQMQETEVKTFHETVAAYEAENARLRRRLNDIELSRVYRLLGNYRRLRTGLNGFLSHLRRK